MDRITKLEKKSGFCRGREDKEGGGEEGEEEGR